MSTTTRRKGLVWTLLAITCIAAFATVAFAGSNSTTLPRGAELTVSIDSPVTSTEFLIPTGDASRDITVSGGASVGLGEPDATFVYVIDGSGSTASGSGTGCSPILGCEKAFFNNLNAEVINNGSADEVGVVVFGEGAVTADMSSDADDQLLVAPDADSNVSTVIDSVDSAGGVGQYTAKSSGGGATNFAAALNAATTVVSASSNGTEIVVMVSDGVSNAGGGAFAGNLAILAGTGARAYTVAIGSGSSCTGGTDGTLQAIADATGGTCYEILDPGNLPDIIPDLLSTSLDSLGFEVDGGGVNSIDNATIDPDLPQAGPASVTYTTVAAGLTPGDHAICTTAYGSDGAGSADVTQCETIHLYQLTLAPDGAVNELGVDDSEHTVIADLLGPEGGLAPVGGRDIDFSIISGPHADGDQTVATAADGTAPYTYSVLVEPASLGTDTIQACVTLNDPTGESGCTTVTKTWQDTTPPTAACVPTVNPAGDTVPEERGKDKHQNPDGFYQLLADDLVWPDDTLAVYVVDSGSGTVFGPFAVGTNIKYTQSADATPEMKKIGGPNSAVEWHIIGTGDAQLYAVDGSGNTSDAVFCLVPPPPS